MRQRLKIKPFRVLALALIAILFQAGLISPNCLAITGQSGKSIGSPASSQEDPCGSPSCCSLRFCCHFTCVVYLADLYLPLVLMDFLKPVWHLQMFPASINPFNRLPRTLANSG
jgi:hypothetical protein